MALLVLDMRSQRTMNQCFSDVRLSAGVAAVGLEGGVLFKGGSGLETRRSRDGLV